MAKDVGIGMKIKLLSFNFKYGNDETGGLERIYKRENIEPGIKKEVYLIYDKPNDVIFGERKIGEIVGYVRNIEITDEGIFGEPIFNPGFKWIEFCNYSIVSSGYGNVNFRTREVTDYVLSDFFLALNPIDKSNKVKDIMKVQLRDNLNDNFNYIWKSFYEN